MTTLPPLPRTEGYGYDWMDRLSGGWHEVPSWGRDGWDCGNWPYIIMVHYDNEAERLFGMAVYTEGDLDIKEFRTRQERDHATDEWCIWYWPFYGMDEAPQDLSDPRLGPYRGTG
jgi:hypothetical protein